jgi:hypothetical protein
MPTKPYEPLLYRELRKVEAKEIIDIASPLLKEEINYATAAFKRCKDSTNKEPEIDHLSIFSLFHHLIAMIDGIEVLISQSCVVPAIPLLRSAFETTLNIEYILEKDYQQRSYSWLVVSLHDRKSKYEILDTNQETWKNFENDFRQDETSKYFNVSSLPNTAEMIELFNKLLQTPKLSLIEIEYLRMKNLLHRKPNWFSLFNGPYSIEALAKYLKRGAQYHVLYRRWASVSHAIDFTNYLYESTGNITLYKPIRDTEEISTVSVIASSLILLGITKIIGKFRAGENRSLGKWYVTECRKSHLTLARHSRQNNQY